MKGYYNIILQQFCHPVCYLNHCTSSDYIPKHKNEHIKSVFVNCHISRDTVAIAAKQFSLGSQVETKSSQRILELNGKMFL